MRFVGAKAWCLVFVVWGTTAFAQQDSEVNTAYQFAADGLRAFDAGSYLESLDKFKQAFAIVRLPSLALYMARANARLGHLLAARELYSEVARLPDGVGDPEVQQAARRAAAAESESLKASIPRVIVNVPEVPHTNIRVLVDAITVPSASATLGWPVDPGPHQITVNLGAQQQTQLAFVVEGESKIVTFRFPTTLPAPLELNAPQTEAPGHSRWTTAGWISLAIGGTAFAVSGVTSVWALKKHGELDDKGPWDVNHCEQASSVSDCQTYGKLRTASTVGFYTGAIGVATGVTLLLLAPAKSTPKPRAQSRVIPLLGLGYAGVQAEFD